MDALKRSLGISPNSGDNRANGSAAGAAPHNFHRDVTSDARQRGSVPGRNPPPVITGKSNSVKHPPDLHRRYAHSKEVSAAAAPPPRAEVINLTDTADVKNKLMSVWHSVKYGKAVFALDSKVNLAGNSSAVWLLGQCYHKRLSSSSSSTEMRNGVGGLRRFDQPEPDAAIAAFNQDFCSRLWFTYRREFEEFPGTTMTTDCGWGCMIRSGQMLLGNTLLLQHLGRRWRWSESATINAENDNSRHRSIVRLFGDSPQSDLSIHNLVSIAKETLGKKPGDWFGPAATAHLLREAIQRSQNELLQDLCVYVARDCTVYRQDVRDLCRKKKRKRVIRKVEEEEEATEEFSVLEHPDEYPAGLLVTESLGDPGRGRLYGGLVDGVPYFEEAREDEFQVLSDGTENFSLDGIVRVDGEEWQIEAASSKDTRKRAPIATTAPTAPVVPKSKPSKKSSSDWTPVLLLVPVRLGMERLNPAYVPCLQALLATENCVGIIGGRPKHSLYFVGFQEDSLIHLDPHLVQDNVNVFRHNFSLDGFHCRMPRKMNAHKMDPSCCLGFFCPTQPSFEGWCELTRGVTVPAGMSPDYPMFGIAEGGAETYATTTSMLIDVEEEMSFRSDSSGDELVSEDFVFL